MTTLATVVRNLAAEMQRDNPSWRWGQSLFNALYELRPDIADEVRTTNLDPFHDNVRAQRLLIYLSAWVVDS